ncbi:MAG: hypothetical protein NTY19_07660 [Planctomycetota bacterium]|nr:hypothetical protein [Planctomycetota bacterium]
MNKWTILSVVVCFVALAVSVVEARTVRSGGGCANGQCGMATASEATAQAPSGTQTIPTAASADSTKVPEPSDVKVEATAAPAAAAATAAPQRRTSRFASGRFSRLRRSWR